MSSNLVDSLFEEPNESFLEILLLDFTFLKKFDDSLKVLSYYHVERCGNVDCLQCLFAINLRYVYTRHVVQKTKKKPKKKINYCIMRKEQVIASKFFICRVASIEKERIKLDKEFNQTLLLWNKNQ